MIGGNDGVVRRSQRQPLPPSFTPVMPAVSNEALIQVSDYFKVLSEVSRLRVLCVLREGGKKNVSEIIAATGLGQANVSKHLKMLTQSGFVVRQPQGVSVYYSIDDPIVFQLCELVCTELSSRFEQQAQQSELLRDLSQTM